MGWKIIIAPSAQSDLADIVRYIARHNSDAAARLGYELITRAESLANFPEIGRMVPEFRQPDLREMISPLLPHHLPVETRGPTDSNCPLLAWRAGISSHSKRSLIFRTGAQTFGLTAADWSCQKTVRREIA